MKYHLITYGCQMNKADSERIAANLEKRGYKPVTSAKEADLIVVNMCSVRQSAVDRIFGMPMKLKGIKAKKVLTGCILKKDEKKFKELFDEIWNDRDLTKIAPKCQNKFLAYVPISNGCNNFCTYCVVPFTRGRLTCRNHNEIIKEIKNIIKKGAKEIWLLGQNVNSYYSPIRANRRIVNFPTLLKMVNSIPGDFWIRFTSPHPKPSTRAELGAGLVPHRPAESGTGAGDFSWNELIEVMAKSKKLTPYLNLPVQSGDNNILKKMNRPYAVEYYKNLVNKIRSKFALIRKGLERELALSTDVIVGFPGETKKQFENTINLFNEIKYDMAYISQYSPRPGTMAAKMKDSVSKKEKVRRWKIINNILKKTALENNKKYVGKEIEVLIDSKKNGFLIGKSRHYKTVKIKAKDNNLIGKFVKVKIIDTLPWGLNGQIV